MERKEDEDYVRYMIFMCPAEGGIPADRAKIEVLLHKSRQIRGFYTSHDTIDLHAGTPDNLDQCTVTRKSMRKPSSARIEIKRLD